METIEFNVKFTTMMKILNGEKKKFERDIADVELARKLFQLDNDGNCVLNESARDEMNGCELFINSITRTGDFPFILKKYNKIRLIDWYGSAIIADIDSVQIFRNGRCWRISYKLKNAVKIKQL